MSNTDAEVVRPFHDDDAALNYTQGIRKQLVQKIVEHGVPDAEENRKLLLQALKDIDSQALGNKKIKVEERTAAGLAGMSNAVAEVLSKISTKGSGIVVERELPVLGDEVPVPELLPGEIGDNTGDLNFDEFMKPQ